MATEASSVTDAAVDLEAIQAWAMDEPTWESQNKNTTFSDPICWREDCGKPTVAYVYPAANAAAGMGSSKAYPACAEHAGKPWDMYAGGRQRVRTVLVEVERLKAQVAAQAGVIAAARESDNCMSEGDHVWVHINGGGCFHRLRTALARLDALEHAQRNAAAVTHLQADMEAKA